MTRVDVTRALKEQRLVPVAGTSDPAGCIAFLVENDASDAIEVDVGVPVLRCYDRWLVEDGNNRLVAAMMAMWRPYRDAAHAAPPHATVIVDKFHVVQMSSHAVESVRKATRENLTAKRRRTLMRDRFVLLKRERDLTDQERLLMERWALNYPLLGEAYWLKGAFYGNYDSATPDEAHDAFVNWYRSILTACTGTSSR